MPGGRWAARATACRTSRPCVTGYSWGLDGSSRDRFLPASGKGPQVLCLPSWRWSPPALAQDVVGRVTDQTGGVLAGVAIDLVHGGEEHTTVTGADGRFRFERAGSG